MTPAIPPRIGELLGGLSERTAIDAPAEAARVWLRWAEIVGPEIAAHAEPTSLQRGVLRVRTDSPVWATEIGYLVDEIRRRVNDGIGKPVVTEVRVWTGPGGARRGATIRRGRARPQPGSSEANDDGEDDPLRVFERVRTAWSRRRASRSARSS